MSELEIDRLTKRSKKYINSITTDMDSEITTLLHRYICILLSSNIDKSVQLILEEFSKKHGSAELVRFVAKKYQRGTNYNTERLTQTLGLFDEKWSLAFSEYVESTNVKEQLDSLYGLRNSISHGGIVNISRPSLDEYFDAHVRIIRQLRIIVFR